MERYLSKDVANRAKKLKFKFWWYAPYENNFTLTNKYIKVGFGRLHEVVSFLDYVEGKPEKRHPWKYENTFKNNPVKGSEREWIDPELKKKYSKRKTSSHLACTNYPNCDLFGCGTGELIGHRD